MGTKSSKGGNLSGSQREGRYHPSFTKRFLGGKRSQSDASKTGTDHTNGEKTTPATTEDSGSDIDPPVLPINLEEELDRDHVISSHLKLADKLAATWPAYGYLNELNLNELDTDVIERMNGVFQHLLNQHDALKSLSVDGAKSRAQQSTEKQRPSLPSGDATRKRSQFKRASSYDVLDEDQSNDARAQLMAEVTKMREAAQMSTLTRYSKDAQCVLSADQASGTIRRPNDQKLEEMKARIEALELELYEQTKLKEALEQEKEKMKKYNKDVERRRPLSTPSNVNAAADPPGQGPSNPPGPDDRQRRHSHTAEVRVVISGKIKHEHDRLEHVLINEVKTEIDRHVKFVDDQTKFTYLCSIIMELYTLCLDHRDDFDERLHHLLLHPTRQQPAEELKKKRKSQALKILHLTGSNEEERPRSSSKTYVDTQEIPKSLKREALKFVAATSPYLDTTVLTQEVLVHLMEINEKITSKMADNKLFLNFVSDCARMAWQMRVIDPPMRLCADLDLLFNDSLHLPFRSRKVKDAELEYYLWPALMEYDGTIIGRGRVCFKVNSLVG